MKKRIMKLAALLFSAALLALPGTAFSLRQTTPGASTYNATTNTTYACPIPEDEVLWDIH
ncbi:MAG: hypothetical protein K2J60_14315 [Acetatifactor sp.]|nr:hypothetical protein [Acetatifactor sp.]